MAIFKCKMCGGDLNIESNDTIATCEYCGTTQTIPFIDSDKKSRLFNRANEYRLNNEFDRAYNAYETIVNEEPDEAEAYWGLVLSEYGVEYVEDPTSKKRIPTCHRTKLSSILSNKNYLKAIELASGENKMMYMDEASLIDSLQKRIISISSKETPYDVFICYKETDVSGNRTEDSVLGQDIYDALTNAGLRVFFSRISLEDKLGKDYEPFIFNALNTAKVLLLVTTSNENCNAVWVKNEWKRYLDFMKDDKDKTIIPVIQNMSPYELPDELVKLQVQDMSKIGAMQDLTRGVKKIVGNNLNEGGFSLEEKEILNQLKRNEEKSNKIKKILLICALLFVGFFGFVILHNSVGDSTAFKINNHNFSATIILALCCLPVGVALIFNILKGFKSKVANILYILALLIVLIAVFLGFYVGIRGNTFFYICDALVLAMAIFTSILANKKKMILLIILSVLLFAISLVPSFLPRSSKRDLNKEQLIISEWVYMYDGDNKNTSNVIGIVFEGEVFDILEEPRENVYKIKINDGLGIEGYVFNTKNYMYKLGVGEDGNLFVNTEYINVRSAANLDATAIGKVYYGEIYFGKKINENSYWYEIDFNGRKGYVYGGWDYDEQYIKEIY